MDHLGGGGGYDINTTNLLLEGLEMLSRLRRGEGIGSWSRADDSTGDIESLVEGYRQNYQSAARLHSCATRNFLMPGAL